MLEMKEVCTAGLLTFFTNIYEEGKKIMKLSLTAYFLPKDLLYNPQRK